MPELTVAALVVVLCLSMQAPDRTLRDITAKPTPVAVLCNGDDGLTARLCDAVKQIFNKSPDLTQDIANRPRVLRVVIPTNVKWKKVDGRLKVFYSIELSLSDKQNLGVSDGSCWDSRLNDCAQQILVETRNVVARMPQE
jgi:hypothetical protein